ncbi:CRISPR-associated protein Cas4 [Nibrella viscosa]|uniref:CRISPR-associated exonuclease Cas4 n=1 Tax=Nibrella viscosa TaxID=1084524 RepID=A0ABP8KTI6_9BACT
MTSPTNLRVGGMLVGYYRLCPRKAWLSMRGIWMEQESDTVALGRLLDQSSYDRADKHLTIEAVAPDGTALIGKIDRANLREGVLHETKKSRSCEESHIWQVRFYLWLLALNRNNGPDDTPIPGPGFRGQLDYPLLRRTETIILDEEHVAELAGTVAAIRDLATQATPPPRLAKRSFCKQCAYEELCYG